MAERPNVAPFEYLTDQYDTTRGKKRGANSASFLVTDSESEGIRPAFAVLQTVKTACRDIANSQGKIYPEARTFRQWVKTTTLAGDETAIFSMQREEIEEFFRVFTEYQRSFIGGMAQGLLELKNPLGIPLAVATAIFDEESLQAIIDSTDNKSEWKTLANKTKKVQNKGSIIIPSWGSENRASYSFRLGTKDPFPPVSLVLRNPQRYYWPLSQMSDFEIADKMLLP